jgi:hypothetical protein
MFLCVIFSVASVALGAKPNVNRVPLTATDADTDAKGFVQISTQNKKNGTTLQGFMVKAQNLSSRSSYTLSVNGIVIDTLTANAQGTFRINYQSKPTGNHPLLPDLLQPVTQINLIQVKDSQGRVVLTGSFNPTTSGCSSGDLNQDIFLTGTGATATASGRASVQVIKNTNITTTQNMDLILQNLAPSTPYDIFVNGRNIYTFTTGLDGRATVSLSNNPLPNQLLLPERLNLVTLSNLIIKDKTGANALLADTTTPSNLPYAYETVFNLANTPTNPSTPAINGMARIFVEVQDGTLYQAIQIRADNIRQIGRLMLYLNETQIANTGLPVSADGTFSVVMSNRPTGTELPMSTTMDLRNINNIQLRSETGDVILTNAVSTGDCTQNVDRRSVTLAPVTSGTNTNLLSANARGYGQLSILNNATTVTDQRLFLNLQGLEPLTRVKVFVNGVEMTPLDVNTQGDALIRFNTTPRGTEVPFPSFVTSDLLRNLNLIEIRTGDGGQVLMRGTFSNN